ncbi:hypothetical protein SLEP1_g12027 [Rubroshorea leprosula]|nr:hypothetical protein SLEP1_g12027 [Rubroshorea leprosula]
MNTTASLGSSIEPNNACWVHRSNPATSLGSGFLLGSIDEPSRRSWVHRSNPTTLLGSSCVQSMNPVGAPGFDR